MRVCYFGTFDEGYVRNRTLMDGLGRAGAEVQRCHVPLWHGEGERIGAASRSPARALWRLAWAQPRLLRRYAHLPAHDAIVVGYPGHADMLAARVCSRLRRRPLAFDAFLSLYETAIEDRRLAAPHGATAAAMRTGDRLAVRAADLTLLDTQEHVRYFQDRVASAGRYAVVPVSADDVYLTVPPPAPRSGPLHVLYFGAYIPLHGIDVVLRAADQLRGEPVRFTLIGRGQMLGAAQRWAQERSLDNVVFDNGWYSPAELCRHIATADVCLGAFADSPKAARVVPNKVAATLAAGRPMVTADTPAMRSLVTAGEALLCPPGDAAALAQAIRSILDDWSAAARMAAAGRDLFVRRLSVDAVGRCLHGLLQGLGS